VSSLCPHCVLTTPLPLDHVSLLSSPSTQWPGVNRLLTLLDQ